jgi:hypothetical protein
LRLESAVGHSYDAVKIFMPAGAKKPIYAPSNASKRTRGEEGSIPTWHTALLAGPFW